MKYKMISMDFDGTLLTSNKKVTDKNKNVLLKYKKDNYIIVGITARNFSSVNNVCDIDMFNYLILNNGAYIYDVKNKDGINLNSVDKNIAIKITNYFEKIADEIQYCSLNKYYTYKKNSKDRRSFFQKVNDISEIEETICRMNIFFRDDNEINKYKEYIEKTFENIDVIIMSDTDNKSNKKWLTLNPKNMDKFDTLKQLCTRLNISTDEVIFFGDGANDLSIISQVGLGVAMENALEEVKNKAKEITLSNDEDGIAYFLENYNNI